MSSNDSLGRLSSLTPGQLQILEKENAGKYIFSEPVSDDALVDSDAFVSCSEEAFEEYGE